MQDLVVDETLRPWRLSDAPVLAAISTENADLERQIGDVAAGPAAASLIDHWKSLAADGTGFVWAVTTNDVPVGCVGITAIERRHRTGWCWYWIAARARGQGLATRALATAADHAFASGLYRLELAHRTNNPSSCAVASAAGFLAEGIERSKLEYDGERYDCETHARLESDPQPALALLPIVPESSH